MSALISLGLYGVITAASQPAPQLFPKKDASYFRGAEGCFLIKEVGRDWTLAYNPDRCQLPWPPCSTFKIFNALAGLDCGAVESGATEIKWDGSAQRIKNWEKDHTLATAIRDSVLWYFQIVAERIGPGRMREYIFRCDYGNRDAGGEIRRFWLDGPLAISAAQQVRFLDRLYENRLPFDRATMDAVRELLVSKRGDGWSISGMTGSGYTRDGKSLGWYVGYVESDRRRFVFALNIVADKNATGPVARDIACDILGDLNLIAVSASPGTR
jgi:beta-lactamase class D